MQNTLLISTSSWAGMGPYASEIINSFKESDNIYFFLVEDERHFYSKNIDKRLLHKCLILFHKNSKWNKLKDLFFAPSDITKQFIKFYKKNNIQNFHFLTNEIPYSKIILQLNKSHKVFFTVHDLHPHEMKKKFHKEYRQKKSYSKLYNMIDKMHNLITNSKEQYQELKEKYPNKSIYFHEFPSLINQAIINGKEKPIELNNESGYLLFFGRIEAYKGIELLYQAFTNDTRFIKHKLIIAGGGDIYFKRDKSKEQNVIFINRYIKDEEIAFLFQNALITIYPYISASQSGVLSLSCYYQVPILASNVPFFSNVEKDKIGLLFKRNDIQDLANKMHLLINSPDKEQIAKNEAEYYKLYYEKEHLRENLLTIYNK